MDGLLFYLEMDCEIAGFLESRQITCDPRLLWVTRAA
jgi:hypothetical protein